MGWASQCPFWVKHRLFCMIGTCSGNFAISMLLFFWCLVRPRVRLSSIPGTPVGEGPGFRPFWADFFFYPKVDPQKCGPPDPPPPGVGGNAWGGRTPHRRSITPEPADSQDCVVSHYRILNLSWYVQEAPNPTKCQNIRKHNAYCETLCPAWQFRTEKFKAKNPPPFIFIRKF